MPIRMDGDQPGGLAAGDAKMAKQLQLLGAVLILGGRPARKDAAIILTAKVVRTLSTPGRGKVVRSRASSSAFGVGFIEHTASAPGDPPAPDLGELRRSIAWAHTGKVTRVGSNLPQSAPLEFGAPARNLLARPFMRPSLRSSQLAMTRVAVAAYKRATENRRKRGRSR